MKNGILYSLIALLASACLKEQPYQVNTNFATTLAVHAYLSTDTSTQVWVGNSTSILQPDTPNTLSQLYVQQGSNAPFALIQTSPGYYRYLGPSLVPGDSVVFTCTNPLANFSLTQFLPFKPKVTRIDTLHRLNPLVGNTLNVDIQIKDTAAIQNYYRIFFQKKYYQYIYSYTGQLLDSFITTKRIPIYGQKLAFAQNDYNKYASDELLFNDATFNGVKEDFTIYTSDLLQKNTQQRPLELQVIIESLSADLYQYYNSRNAHIWQQKSIIQAPSTVHGNMSNILGVIGAFSQQKYVYKL